jgi:preprotein translocase subunit SecD
MRVERSYLDGLWPRVGRCFAPSESDASRLVNRRQEQERTQAVQKSENNRRPGNTNARRLKHDSDANETRTRSEREQIASIRASASASASESTNTTASLEEEENEPEVSARFGEVYGRWPLRTNEKADRSAWHETVAVTDEPKVFAAIERYLDSQVVSDGRVTSFANWLRQQKDMNWEGVWPARKRSVWESVTGETPKPDRWANV